MKKIILFSILISFLSSCYGKILTADASYKKFYTLKFDKFVNSVGETWTGAKAELTSDESGFNLDYGKIAGNITAQFIVTYTGSNVLTTNPLSFEKIGLSDHFSFDIKECSAKGLKKGESCTFGVTYKYSDSDDLNSIDNLSFLISDPDKISSTIDDLFIVNLSGHRKVKGTLSIDTESIDFGTNDFNLAPEPKDIAISYSGEFNIESVVPELTGSDSLKPLFDVSEITCEGGVSCTTKVKFPALTVAGSAYGANSLTLKYKVILEGADSLEELGNITLEGKRRSETNLVLLNETDEIITAPISLNDLSDLNKTVTIKVKNLGETKTSNFSFTLNNSNDFEIDNTVTNNCENAQVLEENNTCNVKINFTKNDSNVSVYPNSFLSTLNVSSDRIQENLLNLNGKVYEPASLSIEPSGVVDLGSAVAEAQNGAPLSFSTTFITIKKSIGEVPATISSLVLNDNNFSIDNSWVSTEKCNVGSVLTNINDTCLIKVVFNPQEQTIYPKNLEAILNFSYDNGKNLILSNNNIILSGVALKDAELSFDTNTLNFGLIIKDETKTLDLNITNTGGIDVSASFDLINNTSFSIISNECLNVINPNETCKVTLLFNPNSVKSTFTSSLKVTYTNASGIVIEPQIALIANSINPAIISINPITQDFGQHRFGFDGPIQKEFVVTNGGDINATELSSSIANSFQNSFEILDDSTCGATLALGATCNLTVEFDPPINLSEVLNTNLNVNYKDRPASTVVSSTSSQIVAEAISYANLELTQGDGNFGEVLINTENSLLLSFTNNGYSKAVISELLSSSESIAIDTSIINSCEIGTEVEVLETCNIKLVFSPTDGSNLAFNDSFVLTYTSYDISTDLNVDLSANVLVPAKLEILPDTYTFENTEEGSSRADVSFEIKFIEGTSLTQISSINLEDTNNFTLTDTNNCMEHIFDSSNTTCSVFVKFNPALFNIDNISSSLTIVYDRAYGLGNGSFQLLMSGNSIPSNAVLQGPNDPLTFAGIIRGTQSQAQTITINKVSGNHDAVITNVEVLADASGYVNFTVNSICGNANNGNPVPMQETCDLSLIFTPNINIDTEMQVTSSILVTYDDRSGSGSSTTLSLSNILEAEIKLETIIEVDNVDFGNITQGNRKNLSLILNMTQGVPPILESQNILSADVVCSGEIVTSFNIDLASNLENCTLNSAGDICQINLNISDVPATEGLYEGKCDNQYDILQGQYELNYNNGIESVSTTATLSGQGLTPAKLVFNQVGQPFTRNLNEYFCYNYSDPYNDGPEVCQTDTFNQNSDDLIYNGTIIGLSRSYTTLYENLFVENIGETKAKIIESYLNNGPFRYQIESFYSPFTNPLTIQANDVKDVETITFRPTNNNYFSEGGHRGVGEYEIGISYQNGVIINNDPNNPVVINTKDDTTITDAQKKLVLSVTGLKKADLKIKSLDENGNLTDCSNEGNLCQFNNGEDIVYYKDQNGNYEIINNSNTNQLFALAYDDGDVPARLEDPENTSTSLGGFYYQDFPYGTNSDCEVGDYIFNQNTDNLKEYCLIDLSFRHSEGNTTYCGYQHTKNNIYKYSAYVWTIMNNAYVLSISGLQEISSGIRPVLSFENAYCKLDFGSNNSTKTLNLKNYSQENLLLDLGNLNSYYISNPTKGPTQDNFIVNSSTCDEVLNSGSTCDIEITFSRDIQANGHAKFEYYNYRIPFTILGYTNNFDVEADASTFTPLPTSSSHYLKTTKYGSSVNSIATYYCFDCDNTSIDINLSNYTQVPILFTSTKISIRKNWYFLTNNNNLFDFSVDGSSYGSLNLNPAPHFVNGEIDYSMKVKNENTFISNLSSYTFDSSHGFNNFYGFTNLNKTYQFKLTYSSAYDVVSFASGQYYDHITSQGTEVNGDGNKSFIISKNQLIEMCSVMDDKLNDPANPIYGDTDNYLTEDFINDCCGEELGISNDLAFCN